MSPIDCLLIHTPKQYHTGYPFGKCMSIMMMPMGLLGLADKIYQGGISVQLIHYGIEKIYSDGKFSINEYLRQKKTKVIGLTLHWHQQSYNVIELAKKIKKVNPTIKIFVGGITASYFAEEILENYKYIDLIVKGDAYAIISDLVKSLISNDFRSLRKIPNIIFRNPHKKKTGRKHSYWVNEKDYNRINHLNLGLLKNWERYIQLPWAWIKNSTKENNEKNPFKIPIPIGLGCTQHCVYCGGCSDTQTKIFKRKGCITRHQQNVINEMLNANIEYKINRFHFCYNPHGIKDDKYYINLFELIKENISMIDINFECWGLPTEKFINSFEKTFSKNSTITISPETANESIRSKTKGISFSNIELIRVLEYLQKKGINTTLFFTSGLPFETKEHLKETSEFQKWLVKKFNNITIISMPIEIEPGSPIFTNPKIFGLSKNRNSFLDYYLSHKETNNISLGYNTNFLTENEILYYSKRMLINFTVI